MTLSDRESLSKISKSTKRHRLCATAEFLVLFDITPVFQLASTDLGAASRLLHRHQLPECIAESHTASYQQPNYVLNSNSTVYYNTNQCFFVTVCAGTAYRHLFPPNIYFFRYYVQTVNLLHYRGVKVLLVQLMVDLLPMWMWTAPNSMWKPSSAIWATCFQLVVVAITLLLLAVVRPGASSESCCQSSLQSTSLSRYAARCSQLVFGQLCSMAVRPGPQTPPIYNGFAEMTVP